MKVFRVAAGFFALLVAGCEPPGPEAADIVFTGGDVYTVNPGQPWAEAVAVRGNQIAAVFGDSQAAEPYIGADTRVIDLDGRMLLPGFIDGHVHFDRAGAILRDINLLQVSSREGLRKEVRRVVGHLAPGEWITGGHWGAYEEWDAASTGAETGAGAARWTPDRGMVDDLTGDHPLFVQSFEREPELYLANTLALEKAGLLAEPVEGMELNTDGEPTGLIRKGSPAIERLQTAVKPKSHERRMAENRAALKELRRSGVVEIHDVTSEAQMERFVALEEAGDLTARVWMRPDLSRAGEFAREGIAMNTHPETGERDRYLRWGAFKGYVDGIMGNHSALFFEPYDDQPGNTGQYRRHTSDEPEPPFTTGNMDKIYGYLETAAEAGFVANVHAIGTKGVALLLDTFERLREEGGVDLHNYRVIHAQVVRDQDFKRFGELGLVAEVNPFHLSDDMRWMEERIGARAENAYAFKSLKEAGATLVFGSDWPGTNAAYYHVHPKYLIHAAVNRTTVERTPEGGWYPEEKLALETAIRAYTLEGARATFDGAEKGSIEAGKLADLTVLDKNLFEIDKKDILDVEVDLTMVDGEIVYAREG